MINLFFDDLEAALLCELLEFNSLSFWMLIDSRDSHVNYCTLLLRIRLNCGPWRVQDKFGELSR